MSKKSKDVIVVGEASRPKDSKVVEVLDAETISKTELPKDTIIDGPEQITFDRPEFDPDSLLPALKKEKIPALSPKDRDPLAVYLREISRYDLSLIHISEPTRPY